MTIVLHFDNTLEISIVAHRLFLYAHFVQRVLGLEREAGRLCQVDCLSLNVLARCGVLLFVKFVRSCQISNARSSECESLVTVQVQEHLG